MNEPSASLWKKLNEVSDRLQKVSEQLIEANAINRGYHQALEQQRVKVDVLEQDNHKAQGAIAMLKWWLGAVIAIAISGGSWSINSIHELKQQVAIIQSREDKRQ